MNDPALKVSPRPQQIHVHMSNHPSSSASVSHQPDQQQHPLSPDVDISPHHHPRPRRRGTATPSASSSSSTNPNANAADQTQTTRPITNYFDLKRESDARAVTLLAQDVDAFLAQVDGDYPELVTPRSTAVQVSSNLELPSSSSKRPTSIIASTGNPNTIPNTNTEPPPTTDVLTTQWHHLDDASLAFLLPSTHALRSALRTLSTALEDITAQHTQQESNNTSAAHTHAQFEERARGRVKRLMWDLDERGREVARDVLESVFSEGVVKNGEGVGDGGEGDLVCAISFFSILAFLLVGILFVLFALFCSAPRDLRSYPSLFPPDSP